MVVLRSFGKFFGLPGLRLGFALAQPARAAAIRAALGPWAVSGPAIAIGTAALVDTPWQAAMRTRLAAEGEALGALLRAAGLDVLGGTALFRLAAHPRAAALFEGLGARGFWSAASRTRRHGSASACPARRPPGRRLRAGLIQVKAIAERNG